MGFRFFKWNSIYKSYLSRNHFHTYKTLISHNQNNPLIIQAIAVKLHEVSPSRNDPHHQIFKRWNIGHSHDGHGHHHHAPHEGSSKESENIFRLGLAADVGLSAGKAITGYLSGSTAIIADAAHSLSDVVLSGVALLSFKAARVPKDKEHPYGHGKFETLGALGISCMLLATAGGIAWHAIDVLLGLLTVAPEIATQSHEHGHQHKIDMDHPVLALNMTIVSIAVKEGLFWITKRAGEREGSGLMKANAWHHRADAISSVVALIGVGGSILGIKFLDPLAGLVVSGMILKAGLETGYQSVMELVDAAIPQQELEPHRQTILQVEGVKGCHRLRARRAGSFLYLDVHIEVDPFTSVSAAHHVGEIVRRRIHESRPEVAEAFIHIDPAISEVSPDIVELHGESKETDQQHSVASSEHNKDIDDIVSNILSLKFSEVIFFTNPLCLSPSLHF
ncbi:Metal tolerance protein C1, variant 3 [Ancistrocladus abbreviatus]